jgi:hypothetical protein
MSKLKHYKLGAKYAGPCAVCGQHTGSRSFELAATSLYTDEVGKYRVVHPSCAGGSTKSRVNGGVAYRVGPATQIKIP